MPHGPWGYKKLSSEARCYVCRKLLGIEKAPGALCLCGEEDCTNWWQRHAFNPDKNDPTRPIHPDADQ